MHLAHCNPTWNTTTWDDVFKDILKRGRRNGGMHGASTIRTIKSGWNNSCWNFIREKRLIETEPRDLLNPLRGKGMGIMQLIRRMHEHAVGYQMIPYPIVGSKMWPVYDNKPMSMAITEEQHTKVIDRITTMRRNRWSDETADQWRSEWIAYLWILWFTGASNKDAAELKAENINWRDMVIEFSRSKWVNKDKLEPCRIVIGPRFAEVLRALPKDGLLLPILGNKNTSKRYDFFHKQTVALEIEGISIHGYRYAFAERSKENGMSIEDRMATLGHNTYEVHRNYGRTAKVVPVSIEVLDGRLKVA